MKLEELIKSVKEDQLTKEQLEQYHDQLSHLFAQMQLEMGGLEKEEALFMNKDINLSVAQRKIMWKGTESGQRLIVLKRYAIATKEMLNSLKSRTFRLIY